MTIFTGCGIIRFAVFSLYQVTESVKNGKSVFIVLRRENFCVALRITIIIFCSLHTDL